MALADVYSTSGDKASALASVDSGVAVCAQHGLQDLQLVCMLQGMQLSLVARDYHDYKARASAAAELLDVLPVGAGMLHCVR